MVFSLGSSRAQSSQVSSECSTNSLSSRNRRLRVEVVLPTMRELSRTPRHVEMRARLRASRSASASGSSLLGAVVPDNDTDHGQHQDNHGLSPASINSRLDIGGRDRHHIQGISSADLNFTVSRALMSHLYGGSPQSTFPKPSHSKLRDGVDDLAFINHNLNPYAPRRPGATGLLFVINPEWTGRMTKQLFICVKPTQWLYLGLYKFVPATPLTAVEFGQLHTKVRLEWVNYLIGIQWAREIIVRIALRDENGGKEPSVEDVAAICADKQKSKAYTDKKRVTVEQVMHAFLTGKERLCVSCLKCINYDSNWQRYLKEQSVLYVRVAKNKKTAAPRQPQEPDPEPVILGRPPRAREEKIIVKTPASLRRPPIESRQSQEVEARRELSDPRQVVNEFAVPRRVRPKPRSPGPPESPRAPTGRNQHVSNRGPSAPLESRQAPESEVWRELAGPSSVMNEFAAPRRSSRPLEPSRNSFKSSCTGSEPCTCCS
ncbi:hypothetical protein BC835DRAFT_232831 [Cytidiella melzeri]|nr:hypothetical protein BC835DRAFT_232831 [Cytidiella melzeri]